MKKLNCRQTLTSLLLITALSTGLSACGQKGPLYFPQEQVPGTDVAEEETLQTNTPNSEQQEPDDQ